MKAIRVTQENYKEIFSNFMAHGQTYLYGAGSSGKRLFSFLKQFDFPITAFIDDNPSLQNTIVESLPVYSMQDIKRERERERERETRKI